MNDSVRLAVVSTPRSGNTWLRHLLMGLYDLAPYAVHSPDDLDWSGLAPRAALQLHWHPTPDFSARLAAHGFRIVTTYRHPFDVLLSILQFCRTEPLTARWLQGEGGSEAGIVDATPRSAAFRAYCASERARALLSVSDEWAARDGVVSVRYEDLVADTAGELHRLVRVIGARPVRGVEDVAATNSLDELRSLTGRPDHFWRGTPGHWRSFLDAGTAGELAAGLAPFECYAGYSCEADPQLGPGDADHHWVTAVGYREQGASR